jgi:hypothetical protein
MNKRMSITLVLVLLIGSMLAACGGGAPASVPFSQLPVFTGATETTNATLNNALTTQLEKARSDAQIKNADGKVYDLPADTTWDAISSFYKTALEKAGWTVAQSGDNLLAFSRGQQAFVINFAAGPVLIAVLTEMK